MRIVILVLGFIAAILAAVMTILPFGSLAFIPIGAAFIFGLISYSMSRKDSSGTAASKFLLIVAVITLALGIYRTSFNQNVVADGPETIEMEEESLEEAKKELEGIEIDE